MKNILLIGVGGTGSRAVDTFFKRYQQFGKHNDNHISALVFDTDAGDVKNIDAATPVVMADSASVGTICDRIGKNYLREWFPCDDEAIRSQEMVRGASQWRKKSYLAFLNLMNKPLARASFIGALEKMVADPSAICEIYVISSVAGGTGSGSFIPIALYAKRYLRKIMGKDPIVNAMIALPEIFADAQTPENRIKIYSNAYAILRELNAINLVARNYNAGRTAQKKAPIKFRIGHPDEPNVGVLFDASDKAFWTPEAAPFSQVFLLDRIPGLNSIGAHEIVLANSLYTILCTDIGAAFDSEFSNHELLRSQNNGSNAIYAGVSTSQIRFPRETILDYIAHRKTLDTCDNEWLILHKMVEADIREKEQMARESKRRYTMRDGEYAELVLDAVEELKETGSNDEVVAMIERGTVFYDKEGNLLPNPVEAYFEEISTAITGRIPNKENLVKRLENQLKVNPTQKPDKGLVVQRAKNAKKALLEYFKDCVEEIKSQTTGAADACITLDKKKQDYANGRLAITERLLKKDGKFLNPVAAMVQLCRLRKKLGEELEGSFTEWEALRQRDFDLPKDLCRIKLDEQKDLTFKESSSVYFKRGEERFQWLLSQDSNAFKKYMTNAKADNLALQLDAKTIAMHINNEAQNQLKQKVLARIARDIDLLIDKYRTFFTRFDKEKEELAEATKTALRRDSKSVDSAINVYSSEEDKKAIFQTVLVDGGPASESELIATDDVVGKGVFTTAYKSAIAASSGDLNWNDKDSTAYRSLFDNMVKAYTEFIGKNEAFVKIANYNAVEAIVASCGDNANEKQITAKLHEAFASAQELATPSLRVNMDGDESELVQPSTTVVFMISLDTGKYIKKHAEEFGLRLPVDQTKESDVIRSCSEEFIRKYSGNSAARVSIVSTVSDQVLYCTGEIMDITPLRISKFDELGPDNIYYRNYCIAIDNGNKYNTDMWFPHIGFDLHKRGYLPYMNVEKEKQCDDQMVKALFYAFSTEKILYKDGIGEYNGRYYFEYNGTKITDPDGKLINKKNIAQLMAWIRNQNELVEDWSTKFDEEIARQVIALPSIASDNVDEIRTLEGAMTKMPFMKLLTDHLYTDEESRTKIVKLEGGKAKAVEKVGPTVFEFAHLVKTSEEISRDCDDAERILSVAFDVYKQICEYRTNPQITPERFIQIYRQQLENIYEAIAGSSIVYSARKNAFPYFQNLVIWLNRAGTFTTISTDNPMDDKGNVSINYNFDLKKADEVKKILTFIVTDGKDKTGEMSFEELVKSGEEEDPVPEAE